MFFPNDVLVIYEKDSQLAKMQVIRPFKPNSSMPYWKSTNDNVVCMIEDLLKKHLLGYICIKLLKVNNGKYILPTITFLLELSQDFKYVHLLVFH